MMRILVTGCYGYIGSVLVTRLLAQRHQVFGLDSGLYRDWVLDDERLIVPCVADDVRDVTRADLVGLDAVIHLGVPAVFCTTWASQSWSREPASTTGFPGDLLVQLGQATPIFVEVKGPDWEGEFQSEMEKEEFLERKSLGKYVDGEARAGSPVQIPFTVIRDNALKKFADDRPNMAVVVDDMMLSPADARGVIDGQVEAFFREPATTRLGAILFLLPEFPAGSASRYVSNFYDNAAALVPCQLPKAAVAVLADRAEQDSAMVDAEPRRWSEDHQGSLEDLARRLCASAQTP